MFQSLEVPPTHPLAVPFGNWFTRFLGKLWLKMFGWRIEGTFADDPYLVVAVAPHTSNWDFPLGLALAWAMKTRFSWIGKHSMFRRPFGKLMRSWGGIPVNRSAPGNIIDQVVDTMMAQKWCHIAISPEGTRKRVKQWKTGFLRIAQRANIPVQLISFDYAKRIIHIGKRFLPGDDVDADMKWIREYFVGVTPRRIAGI